MGVVFDPLLGQLRTSDATAVTLTANSTVTSGFSAGQILYSDGSKLQATGALYDVTLGLVVGGTQGYYTSGRGGILQGADGVYTFNNNAGTNTFNLTAGVSNLATFSAGLAATKLALGGATIGANTAAITGNVGIFGSNFIYKAAVDATNYERVGLFWSGSNASLFVDKAGTGATRNLVIQGYGSISILPGNSNMIDFSTAGINAYGKLVWNTDNTSDIGTLAATSRPANIYAGTNINSGNNLVAQKFINWSGQSRVVTQFDKTSNVTLANITGLSVTVVAAKTYSFEALLYTTSNIAGGVQIAIAGTATATAITYDTLITDAGVTTQSTRATALATAGGVTAVTAALVKINGTITVNGGGTLTVQFAQNASNGAASSVLAGSTFIVQEF